MTQTYQFRELVKVQHGHIDDGQKRAATDRNWLAMGESVLALHKDE
jgi:hypothetical protein